MNNLLTFADISMSVKSQMLTSLVSTLILN